MVRNHFTHVRWLSFFSIHTKQSRRKCNLIVIYVMCWKMALVWQNSMDESGDVLLENILFEKEWMECVIHVSYSIYVYLNFAVISTAIATWFPHTLFPVGLCYYTRLTYFGAFSFPPLSPLLSIVKMTTVDSFLKIAERTIWNLLRLIRGSQWG